MIWFAAHDPRGGGLLNSESWRRISSRIGSVQQESHSSNLRRHRHSLAKHSSNRRWQPIHRRPSSSWFVTSVILVRRIHEHRPRQLLTDASRQTPEH